MTFWRNTFGRRRYCNNFFIFCISRLRCKCFHLKMTLSHKPTYWLKQNGSGDTLFQSQNCNKIPSAKLTVKWIIYCKYSIFIYSRQKHPPDVFYNFIKKETLKHVFSCEFFKTFKKTFLNPIQNGGGGGKNVPYQFFHCNSCKCKN